MFARFLREISLGSRPRNPGIETISFSWFSLASAEPNLIFNNSACWRMIEQPTLMSSVITFPPKGITAVCLIIPSWKIAISVVPPPMSTNTTPASFSSSVKTASEEASGSRNKPFDSRFARLTHLKIFFAACSLSRMYSCGIT